MPSEIKGLWRIYKKKCDSMSYKKYAKRIVDLWHQHFWNYIFKNVMNLRKNKSRFFFVFFFNPLKEITFKVKYPIIGLLYVCSFGTGTV